MKQVKVKLFELRAVVIILPLLRSVWSPQSQVEKMVINL